MDDGGVPDFPQRGTLEDLQLAAITSRLTEDEMETIVTEVLVSGLQSDARLPFSSASMVLLFLTYGGLSFPDRRLGGRFGVQAFRGLVSLAFSLRPSC